MAEISDEELIRLSLEDSKNFAEIIQRYEQKLFRYIMRTGNFSETECEDVLQDVFIKVYVHLNEYENSYAFSSWLYRIAHNTTIDAHRRRSVGSPIAFDDEMYQGLKETLSTGEDIPSYIEQEDLRLSIQKALQLLKTEQRDVMILRYIEGKDYEEISDILGIPIGTVGTLVHRAKKNLEGHLSSIYNYL